MQPCPTLLPSLFPSPSFSLILHHQNRQHGIKEPHILPRGKRREVGGHGKRHSVKIAAIVSLG